MRDTTIVKVIGRRVWTAVGTPALEAEVQLGCGARGRAIASPADAWTAAHPPANAVAAVNGLLAAALHGIDARRQDRGRGGARADRLQENGGRGARDRKSVV